MSQIERTLIIFKPDAVTRGIVGEVLSRFEKVGLKIVGAKMLAPTDEQFHHHYETIGTMITRHGEEIFKNTVEMMKESPVLLMVLEGVEAVEIVRKMNGKTEPKSSAPGTIRGDYAHMSYAHADGNGMALNNIIHASGDQAEAAKEIAHWFAETDLFSYQSIHDLSAQRVRKASK